MAKKWPKRSVPKPRGLDYQRTTEEISAWGFVGNTLGHLKEREFVKAVSLGREEGPGWPEWFVSVRQATEEEDRKGIDVVVETEDAGSFFIQLKISERKAKDFLASPREGRTRIAVIVLRLDDGPETMRNRFLEAAKRERRWLLQRRNGVRRLPREPTVVFS